MAPLMALIQSGVVPPEVVERGRSRYKANVRAVADEFNYESRREWEIVLRRYRLLSLCAERSNPLLWSHYADSHQGVAFEFDASCQKGVHFGTAKPVKYRKCVPRAYSRKDFIESVISGTPLPDCPDTLLPLVLTKSAEWSYEKEWRIARIAPQDGDTLFADLGFCPRSLRSIFFGCRISRRDGRAIEKLLAGDFSHVEIHQARQSMKRFALEFDRIR